MNRVDVQAAAVRPTHEGRRTRRDGRVGDLVPVLAVTATVVVAVVTAPHTPHTTSALIRPVALTNHDYAAATPDRAPAVPDVRGKPRAEAQKLLDRAGFVMGLRNDFGATAGLVVVAQTPAPGTPSAAVVMVTVTLGERVTPPAPPTTGHRPGTAATSGRP
jgi:hypothetical protein